MIEGVIFDFNGTLFWDSRLHYDAWIDFSKKLRGKPFSDYEMKRYMFGRTNADIIEYALGKKLPVNEIIQLAKEKESHYRDMCKRSPELFHLAPGAIEFLNFLKENHIPRTIATMSEKDNVDFYIENFKLSNWFDLDKIVYSDGTIPGKPNPDIFLIAAQKIGLSPKNCVVFEDAQSGIEAAYRAGIGKIIAVTSMEEKSYYESINWVDNIIPDFKNISNLLFPNVTIKQ